VSDDSAPVTASNDCEAHDETDPGSATAAPLVCPRSTAGGSGGLSVKPGCDDGGEENCDGDADMSAVISA